MQIHQLRGHIQQIYLVEYQHGLLLLDGCCRTDIALIRSFITAQLKRPFNDLKLVVVTHMHPDHAGAAHKLRRLTGCEIVTGIAQGQWYQGPSGWLMHFADVAMAGWVARRTGRKWRFLWYWPYLKPDHLLEDGQVLPGFQEWQVIETPGHTDRDISLFHAESRRIYIADVVVKVRNRFLAPFPIFYPSRYRMSVARIRALNPQFVLLAHGGDINTYAGHPIYDIHLPEMPKTYWRALKYRIRQLVSRQ